MDQAIHRFYFEIGRRVGRTVALYKDVEKELREAEDSLERMKTCDQEIIDITKGKISELKKILKNGNKEN